MSRTAWTILVVIAVLLVVYIALEWATRDVVQPEEPAGQTPETDGPPTAVTPPEAEPVLISPEEAETEGESGLRTTEVVLYFSRPDGLGLAPERVRIFQTELLLDRIKQLAAALIRGPSSVSRLLPVLPPVTPLRDLFLEPDGTLYLDLGQELVRDLPRGTASERLAVGSLVNTLAMNFPEVRRVRILVEGEEVKTLGGHLDLSYPLEPDLSLIIPEEALPFPRDEPDFLDLPDLLDEKSPRHFDGPDLLIEEPREPLPPPEG